MSPPKLDFRDNVLPAPLVGGAKDSYIPKRSASVLPKQSENGLPSDYYQYLVSGGTGLTSKTPDTRITNVNDLPAGPFQLTNGSSSPTTPMPQARCTASTKCGSSWIAARTHHAENPSGCNAKLFPWVEVTVGAGTNGVTQPANFSTEYSPGAAPPVKAPRPWAFTTCSRATLPTSRPSPTTTR